ncbi:hypothetical protein [Roseomonas mucosa]|uniref:hypothetical protein n=1 Tax=Roseomonas mucosa TaxID=207340 RepID=UPI002247DC35|nr:hypothetical protein [Roseomonas mucosa]
MARQQELPAAIETLDDQMGFAAVPLAPHHHNHLAGQRVVHRRDQDPFNVAARSLISMSAVVPTGPRKRR